jgi:ankyrin repeat protein
MLASKAGNLEIAEYLIEKNANINSTNVRKNKKYLLIKRIYKLIYLKKNIFQ